MRHSRSPKGIFLFTQACLENTCYGPVWELSSNDEMAGILGMMALDIVLYFSAFLYLDQVLPSAYGVPQHPLFCFMPLVRLWRRRRGTV